MEEAQHNHLLDEGLRQLKVLLLDFNNVIKLKN